jgi:hypothetical protein
VWWAVRKGDGAAVDTMTGYPSEGGYFGEYKYSKQTTSDTMHCYAHCSRFLRQAESAISRLSIKSEPILFLLFQIS